MGCTMSKIQSKQDACSTPLLRSMSVPKQSACMEGESFNKISWKSRPYSMPRLESPRNDLSSIAGGLDLEEQFDTEELLRGFEDGVYHKQAPAATAMITRERRLLDRSSCFHPMQEVDGKLRFSVCFVEDGLGTGKSSSVDPSFTKVPCSPISPSRRCSVKMDRSIGLRLLLNPDATTSQTFTSSARNATLTKSLSSNGSFTFRDDTAYSSGSSKTLDIPNTPSAGDTMSAIPECMTTAGTSADSNSPLFDPSILATFEKAVEALSDDSWQSSDVSTGNFSENVSSPSEIFSDADSSDLLTAGGAILQRSEFSSWAVREERPSKGVGTASHRRSDAFYKKKTSFAKVAHLDNVDREGNEQDYLERFEFRSPPGGDGKIVLYFTSLRGIRKTYEDCCTLLLIFKGFRMDVDERDVWMHSEFRQELTNVMGEALSVPRLFIKGRYIGGAEEVKQLHEEGILGKLLQGLPTEWRNECNVCGGVRFIPCITCSGSCKMITQDAKKSRCPDCNENGLTMCPSCGW